MEEEIMDVIVAGAGHVGPSRLAEHTLHLCDKCAKHRCGKRIHPIRHLGVRVFRGFFIYQIACPGSGRQSYTKPCNSTGKRFVFIRSVLVIREKIEHHIRGFRRCKITSRENSLIEFISRSVQIALLERVCFVPCFPFEVLTIYNTFTGKIT